MIVKRPADTRGNPRESWISSFRTFYFPPYMDQTYTNYSDLETINDDCVQPGGHVPRHLHRNMEIFGYVVKGSCRHTDNLGNDLDIPAGGVQRMSAGQGIFHTEGNAGQEQCRYLQLWVRPNRQNVEPRWSWHEFTRADKLNKFCDITAKLPIYSDARLLAGIFTKNYLKIINDCRHYYLYVVSGTATINGIPVLEGDGLSFEQESQIEIVDPTESEIIVFDLV